MTKMPLFILLHILNLKKVRKHIPTRVPNGLLPLQFNSRKESDFPILKKKKGNYFSNPIQTWNSTPNPQSELRLLTSPPTQPRTQLVFQIQSQRVVKLVGSRPSLRLWLRFIRYRGVVGVVVGLWIRVKSGSSWGSSFSRDQGQGSSLEFQVRVRVGTEVWSQVSGLSRVSGWIGNGVRSNLELWSL